MLIMLNSDNRPHAEIYGRDDAYYDVMDDDVGELNLLYPGAICCVLSYAKKSDRSGDVILSFWKHKSRFEDDGLWCLIGEYIGETRMPKKKLAKHPDFVCAFNRDGNFNRFGVKESFPT